MISPRSFVLIFMVISLAAMAQGAPPLDTLAERATNQDPAMAADAIAQLRAAGPRGLASLIDANRPLVEQHRAGLASNLADDPRWRRVASAIDAVAAQKDAWASGLYWYTDLDAAKQAAHQQGKPILSLRLLGTLDSEYSCANSRYFRTVLYANSEVSQTLSQKFILHWKSVRPVPKVTIDFGDGRVVQRTITGNSIHYVLDADGQVVDAIPGLYGPKAFLWELSHSEPYAIPRKPSLSDRQLGQWHASENNRILTQWRADLRQIGAISDSTSLIIPTAPQGVPIQRAGAAKNPPAAAAAPRAASKAVLETRIVIALSPDPQAIAAVDREDVWNRLAELHAGDSRLDSTSRVVIATKNPTAVEAGASALAKTRVESPLVKMVANFEHSIAVDSVRNEYTFHRQIHAWLAAEKLPDGKPSRDVESLNERVYADLFLTPSSDPWLGLLPPDTYSALPNDGLCQAAPAGIAQQTAPITKK